MAALAADVNASTIGNVTTHTYTANAADTYYRGSVVYSDTTSGNAQVTNASGDRCIGICPRQQTVAASAKVEVLISGFVWLPLGSGVTVADVGSVLVNDGNTAGDNPADMKAAIDITLASPDMAIGVIKDVVGSQMLIDIGNMTGLVALGAGTWS